MDSSTLLALREYITLYERLKQMAGDLKPAIESSKPVAVRYNGGLVRVSFYTGDDLIQISRLEVIDAG